MASLSWYLHGCTCVIINGSCSIGNASGTRRCHNNNFRLMKVYRVDRHTAAVWEHIWEHQVNDSFSTSESQHGVLPRKWPWPAVSNSTLCNPARAKMMIGCEWKSMACMQRWHGESCPTRSYVLAPDKPHTMLISPLNIVHRVSAAQNNANLMY